MEGKAEYSQHIFCFVFSHEIIFFKPDPKKVASLSRFRFRLENEKFFFLIFKDVLKSIC